MYLYQVGKLYENKGVAMATPMDGEAFGQERVTLELLEAESASLQDSFTVATSILKKLRPVSLFWFHIL